jgi:DNA polymerase III epsilon subunit-like protein
LIALTSRSAQPGRRREPLGDAGQQRGGRRKQGRQLLGLRQRQPQRQQFARAHLAQRDARGDALHVAGVLQLLAQRAPGRGRAAQHRGLQRADGFEPGLRLAAVAPGRQQPALQQAAAHARHAGVEQREHRGRVFAAQRLHQLEVAPRGGRQLDQVAIALDRQPLHVRERAALRVLGVAQQRGGRGMRVGERLGVPGGQAVAAHLLAELALAQAAVELPGGTDRQRERRGRARGLQALLESGRDLGAVEQLARRDARDPGFERIGRALGQPQLGARHAEPRQPAEIARARVHREQQRFALVAEQFGVGQRAGRDHPHHLALDRPLARADLAHLLADGHRFAQLDEPREVGVDRMEGHAAHHHRLAGRLAALGERDVEQARGLFGVGPEQLVEVAHPVEQQGVRVVRFEAEVLRHHGRVPGEVAGRGGGLGSRRFHSGDYRGRRKALSRPPA